MLAGVRPFAADNPRATIDLILTSEPDLRARRPDLPVAIGDMVHRALSKDPARRFANGRRLLDALQGCRPVAATPVLRWPAPGPRTLRLGAAVVGLLIIATVVSFRIRSNLDSALAGGAATVSHVMWVDDNPENNTEVVRRLDDRGVQVTTVLNTEEALARYDPTVHELVISDMGRYEGVDDAYVGDAGFDLFERLRARREDVRLVFCTSPRGLATHRAEALAAGALAIVADCDEILPLIGL